MSAIVVDDDDFTRVLLTRTLESAGHTSVVAAADAASGMRLADTHRPDLAILDLDLGPGPNGIDLAHGLRRLNPTIAIIILSSYQDPRLVGSTRPMPLGAIYVSKRSVADAHVLEEAVTEVLASPLAERAAPAPAAPGSRKLSDNQVEIMRLVAEGYSNAEIARRRSLTEPAVAKAVARLVKQLGLEAGAHDNVRVLITQAYYELIGSSRVRRD
ncbi:MAG: DNA-binding response regulator [Actinobacteria bacterium]|nr:DNA-binding response regulator [Actinomycetota bacterium]